MNNIMIDNKWTNKKTYNNVSTTINKKINKIMIDNK